MALVVSSFPLLSFYFVWITYGVPPISEFESNTIPAWYPYNLIETDPACHKTGPPYCPMFPPGGRLSVFPNAEEKFHMALHNMHRMHKNPNHTAIQNVDITKWWGGGWSVNTYNAYYSSSYCSTYSTLRRPLYWYSDANTAARLKAWDQGTCTYGGLQHNLCNNANSETIWSSTGNIDVTTNRCSIFGGCGYSDRSGSLSTEDNDNKGEKPWFFEESICGGNSCFKDAHCDAPFATYNDFMGSGFVEGMNGVTHQYVRTGPDIFYPLPIAAHYDDRMKTKPSDRDGTGKFFSLILNYFHDNNPASKCYALYEDTYTEMGVLLDEVTGSGRSQWFRAKFFPPDNCRPYKFICRQSDGSFVNLPEEDTYFFGTDMMEWEYTLDPTDGVDGVAGATLASLAGGYDCDEQHYYYTGTEWIVNGGPTLKNTADIYYYHNGGTCRGCQYISILECWQTCIKNNFASASCDCGGGSNTPSPVTPSPVTASPITPSPITPSPITPSPITASPITASPTTASPITPSPITASPITPSPTTASPVTASPTTAAPITASPTTASPTSASPTTASPTTASPTTASPTTTSPSTSPTTASPTTASPTTTSPTTASPTTTSPSTSPTTASPTTASPTTTSPTTASPTTTSPTTELPTSDPSLAPTPDGYTCIDVINYEQVFNRVRTWNEASDAGTYLGTCEEDFQAIYPLCGEWNSASMEYYYYFIYERKGAGGRKSKLYVYMRICCGDGSTFGPNYVIESDTNSPYQANVVLINRYQSPQALNSDDSWTDPSKWEWKHYLVYTIMALIVLCCIIAGLFLIKRHIARKNSFALTIDDYYPDKARGSKRNVIMDHTIQMHGFSSKPGPKHVALPSNIRDSTDGSTDGFTTHIANKYDSTDGEQDYGVNTTMLTPPMQKLGHAVLPSVSMDTPETNPVDTADLEEPPMFSGLPPPVPMDAIPNNVEELNHDDITNAFE